MGQHVRRVERTPAAERGRRQKAEQFAEAAEVVEQLDETDAALIDAIVTLCVHAGIAASDVICMRRIGTHVQGENHSDAIAHLKQADAAAAKHLTTLLGMKTKAGYGSDSISRADLTRAMRAMHALIEAMRAS